MNRYLVSEMYFYGIINMLQNFEVNMFLFLQHIGIGIGVMSRCSRFQRHEEVKMALCWAITSGEKDLIENKWQVFGVFFVLGLFFFFCNHLYDKLIMY